MSNDKVADFLTRIRNAQKAQLASLTCPLRAVCGVQHKASTGCFGGACFASGKKKPQGSSRKKLQQSLQRLATS